MELVSKPQKNIALISVQALATFKHLCEELSIETSNYGIAIEPYSEKGIEQFLSFDPERQYRVIDLLKTCLQQIVQANHDKIKMTGDNRQHAWWFLRGMGLIPPPELFDQIDPKDMIEIYDRGCIQIFRSLELFKYMSYSFSEIFCFTWMDLFKRDEFVFKRISETVGKIFSNELKGIIKPNFPTHYAEEVFSNRKIWIKMESGIMCKLYGSDGSAAGFLYTFKIREHGTISNG